MLTSNIPSYLEWIDRARTHADGRIPVRAGLECDWLNDCEPWIEELRSMHDWDYLIGSVHYLGSEWDFDNPKWLGKWNEVNVEEVWTNYWKTYTTMADSGLFNILAHPDLIKKFGYKPSGDLSRFYEPTIDAIATSGCLIEINTAGWHKKCAEQYPHSGFLDLANQAGIDIIISSDAHHPSEVGRGFSKAINLAKAAGYSHTMLIEKGIYTPEPLE